jgi:iron-sulfur cluster assembly accessory protein
MTMETVQKTDNPIKRDMIIGELVQKYPEVVDTLQAEGVHCVGCGAAVFETIEQGLSGHGLSDSEIDAAVERLNQAYKNVGSNSAPVENKVNITDKAAEKLIEVLKAEKKESYALRVGVKVGGCSGKSYDLSLEKEHNQEDFIFIVNNAKFIIDPNSMKDLRGATIDYIDGLQGAGFG